MGIILPRLILVNLGSEANGLLGSVRHILVYVALLEAGVGVAAKQALFGPVAVQNRAAVSGIMAATDRFFKRAGLLYFVVVLVLALLLPFAINTNLPVATIALVVLFSGLPGAVNFYFQGKFIILLQAEGKRYFLTNLTTLTLVMTNLTKILLLKNGYDVVALQLMFLLFSLLQAAVIMLYMKKKYHWLDLKVKPDYGAIAQSKNALIHQISALVFNNTDLLILTFFLGLKAVSVYTLYAMLFGVVATFIHNFSGVNFILGQAYHTDKARFLKLHDAYELFNMTLTFSLFCVTHLFILPFMKLYTSGVTDINYINPMLPVLFVATYLLSNGRSSSLQVTSFAQHFKQTQWRSLFEAVINLSVSLILVNRLGIYGVFIGTIAALLYRTNDLIIYANKKLLNRSPWVTYRRWLLNLSIYIAIYFIFSGLLALVQLDTYPRILLWASVSALIIIPVFFMVVFMFDKPTYKFAKDLLRPYFRAGITKLRSLVG